MTALLAAVRLLQSSIFHVADIRALRSLSLPALPDAPAVPPSDRERKEREGVRYEYDKCAHSFLLFFSNWIATLAPRVYHVGAKPLRAEPRG